MVRSDLEMEWSAGLTRPADALHNGIPFLLRGLFLGNLGNKNNRQMQSKVMNRLQLVVYPLRHVLLGWKQIGGVLFEENPMFLPELCYEANESASERAEGGGRRTPPLHVSPVNLDAHVIVASGIFGMRIGVVPILASPCHKKPISSI